MGTTIKKQHYIWRKYLIPWTNNNLETGTIFVYRKNPRGTQQVIEQRELMKIGFENYYYDISGFTDKDISIFKQFIEYLQENQIIKLDFSLSNWNFAKIQKDFIEKEIISEIEHIDNFHGFLEQLKSKNHSFYKDSIGQILFDILRYEEQHRILFHEQVISDDDLYECIMKYKNLPDMPDMKYEFNLFFWMQYCRSPRIHDNLVNAVNEVKNLSNDFSDLNTNFFINLLTIFYAQKVALNVTQNLKSALIIYENKTVIPFITGDTPIVIIPNSNDHLTIYYYPISPKIAVCLGVSNVRQLEENRNIIMEESCRVIELNNILYKNCVNEVYSNSKEVLESYFKFN